MFSATKFLRGFKNKTMYGFFAGMCVGITVAISTVYLGSIAIRQPREEGNYADIFPLDEYKTENIHQDETDLSDAIKVRIRILCFALTQPRNHRTNAAAVLATWSKRCNVFYFVSTQEVVFGNDDGNSTGVTSTQIETAIYRANESRSVLWNKTKTGFQYAYDNYFDEADWFVKADDDTYIILENLRLLLLDKDPSLPVYYGCSSDNIKMWTNMRPDYMAGGAGYVLSKEALRRFVEEKESQVDHCHYLRSGPEDINMGNCMKEMGVAAGESRDWVGLHRFLPVNLVSIINKSSIDEKLRPWRYMCYPHELSLECCSDSVISFHYMSVDMMWSMEYLVYHVHPFGIHPKLTGANVKHKIEKYLKRMDSPKSEMGDMVASLNV